MNGINGIRITTQPARRLTNQDQGLALRDTLDNNNQDLKKYLDNWVSEATDEREVRERVKDHIRIINGQLVVEGNLDLNNTNISSLPQGLTVGGHLYLNGCTSLTELPQDLHVGGNLYLGGCTGLTTLPDWVFNIFDLLFVPDYLQQTGTYKIFQILKHFDTHNTIDDINNQELIGLYNQDQINTLIHNRHCFRIAYSLCNNEPLTSQQLTFKDTSNDESKNQIRDHLIHMIISFRPDIFKKLPGINKPSSLSIVKDSNNNISGIGILPFVANSGFPSTVENQQVRMACESFKKSKILDQKEAFSLDYIEQVLQA